MRRGEGCLVIYGLVASFKAEKRKVDVGDAWFRVSPSFSELTFRVCWRRLPSFELVPLSRNLSFMSFFSSDRIKLGFLYLLLRRSSIDRKITFTFFFLTNFIDISRCADPMRRTPLFFILKKVSAPITPSECSRGR